MANPQNVKAEGQDDGQLCWAACMAWWTRATDRADRDQTWFVETFDHLWMPPSDGTLSDDGMLELLSYPEWRMYYERVYTASNLTPELVGRYLNYGPVVIGFYDTKIGSPHVNNLYKMDATGSNPRVWVMEPRYKMRSDGTFRGKHLVRNLSHYQSPGCTIFIACPKP